MEQHNIKPVSVPVDMNTAAITGARIGLAKADRVAVVCHMGDSTGATVEFTLKQHNAASAGTSKNLSVANAYYHKVAAATVFTKVQPTVAAAAYDLSSLFAADEGVVVFEVRGEDLDVDGGFAWFSVDVADSVAAKILSAVYVMSDCRSLPAYSESI
jgi:hypothetical protein